MADVNKRLLTELQGIFRDVFDEDDLNIFPEMSAKDHEDWDSLTQIQLIVKTEKHWRIKFTTSEISALKNVGDFLALIESTIARG